MDKFLLEFAADRFRSRLACCRCVPRRPRAVARRRAHRCSCSWLDPALVVLPPSTDHELDWWWTYLLVELVKIAMWWSVFGLNVCSCCTEVKPSTRQDKLVMNIFVGREPSKCYTYHYSLRSSSEGTHFFFRKRNFYSGLCKSFAHNQFLLQIQPIAVF